MKINPMCDLLVGNRPENDSDTQYYECEDCYRYEICKNYGCVEMCSIKEIKEATPNILEPSYDLLKQEGYFEMSMISEQVKKLRIAAVYEEHSLKILLEQAADTIEALSAKLAAANMERSDRYYGGGWIACEDRLPELNEGYECFKQSECVLGTTKWYDGDLVQEVAWLNEDGRWSCESNGVCKVVAWQPLPEPYRP